MSKRNEILALIKDFYNEEHKEEKFIPGKTPILTGGRYFNDSEIYNLVDASLDFWLTEGRYTQEFKKYFSEYVDIKHAIPVNSGSSANLVALSSLFSDSLGDKKINKGDEIITVASGFPTTVNPIIQNGAIPVYIDCELGTYNINPNLLEEALSEKTKAVMIAHTLGNPFDLDEVMKFCNENNLFLIEDCADALGSKYADQHVGTFGEFGTCSFFPAHHITTGEGGMVFTKKGKLKKIAESYRDWGRDCWCIPGESNTCNRRYDWQLGNLPYGYDHKYIYSHIGYNLKITDLQSAIGVAQLEKIDNIVSKRNNNWDYLNVKLKNLEEFFVFPLKLKKSQPSWFGFPLTIRDNAPFNRFELIAELDSKKIGSRFLFGGNLLWQPAYNKVPHREIGNLSVANKIALDTFWLGVFPGLTMEMLDFIIETIQNFVNSKTT